MTHPITLSAYRSPEDAARIAAAGTQGDAYDCDSPAFAEHDDGPLAVVVLVLAAAAVFFIGLVALVWRVF